MQGLPRRARAGRRLHPRRPRPGLRRHQGRRPRQARGLAPRPRRRGHRHRGQPRPGAAGGRLLAARLGGRRALLARPPTGPRSRSTPRPDASQDLLHIHISCLDPQRRPGPRIRHGRPRLGDPAHPRRPRLPRPQGHHPRAQPLPPPARSSPAPPPTWRPSPSPSPAPRAAASSSSPTPPAPTARAKPRSSSTRPAAEGSGRGMRAARFGITAASHGQVWYRAPSSMGRRSGTRHVVSAAPRRAGVPDRGRHRDRGALSLGLRAPGVRDVPAPRRSGGGGGAARNVAALSRRRRAPRDGRPDGRAGLPRQPGLGQEARLFARKGLPRPRSGRSSSCATFRPPGATGCPPS